MTSFFDFCVYFLDYYAKGEFNCKNKEEALALIQKNAKRLTQTQFESAISFVMLDCAYTYANRHDNDGLIDIVQ